MSAARRLISGAIGTLALLSLAGCVDGLNVSSGPSSDFIVISDFALPQGAVRLDPSFGFSLHRGDPGVPAQQRAASIGRAVGFLVTDTITDRLRTLGYDAVSTTDPSPKTDARALLISGTFHEIDEGDRADRIAPALAGRDLPVGRTARVGRRGAAGRSCRPAAAPSTRARESSARP